MVYFSSFFFFLLFEEKNQNEKDERKVFLFFLLHLSQIVFGVLKTVRKRTVNTHKKYERHMFLREALPQASPEIAVYLDVEIQT